MNKKMVSILTAAFCVSALLAGCGAADTAKTTPTIKNKIYIKRAAYQFLSTAAP